MDAENRQLIIASKYSITNEKGAMDYIDRGAFGVVYKGHNIDTKGLVAIKLLDTTRKMLPLDIYSNEKDFDVECLKLRRLTNVPHVLRLLHDEIFYSEKIHIVTTDHNLEIFEPDNKVENLQQLLLIASYRPVENENDILLAALRKNNLVLFSEMDNAGRARFILREILRKQLRTEFILLNGARVLITEYYTVSLQTLANETIGRGGLDIKIKFQIIDQIALALKALHLRNIWHLDVCPANIMFNMPAPDFNYSVLPENIDKTLFYEMGAFLIDIGLLEELVTEKNMSINMGVTGQAEKGRRNWQAPEINERKERWDEIHSVDIVFEDRRSRDSSESPLSLKLNIKKDNAANDAALITHFDVLTYRSELNSKGGVNNAEKAATVFDRLTGNDFLIVKNYMFHVTKEPDSEGRCLVDKVFKIDTDGSSFYAANMHDLIESIRDAHEGKLRINGPAFVWRGVGPAADVYSIGILLFYLFLDLSENELSTLRNKIQTATYEHIEVDILREYEAELAKEDLYDFFVIAKKCVLRKNGYYDGAKDYASYKTLLLVSDIEQAINKYISLKYNEQINAELTSLRKTIRDYQSVLGGELNDGNIARMIKELQLKNDELSSKDSHYEKEYMALLEKEKEVAKEIDLLKEQLSGKDLIISKMEKSVEEHKKKFKDEKEATDTLRVLIRDGESLKEDYRKMKEDFDKLSEFKDKILKVINSADIEDIRAINSWGKKDSRDYAISMFEKLKYFAGTVK